MMILDFTHPSDEIYQQAIEVLAHGGIVIFPTETCYGIGVDATNEEAVQKLLHYKGGRDNKPISVAVADQLMAEKYIELNEIAKTLYSTLLPGPVTVVSKDKGKVARALVSDMQTLGIRIPDFPPLLELIRRFGKPITATSANTSGKKPPYSLNEWQRYTSPTKQAMIDLFFDAGRLPLRPPSTLVDTTLNEVTVLRQGETVIPKAHHRFVSSSPTETAHFGEQLVWSIKDKLPTQPVIVAMQGELGAGKTAMTKGIGKALGYSKTINSPTYTIVHEYPFKNGRLYHIDTWRLHEGKELLELGFTEMLKHGNVVVIEWVQKMSEVLEPLKTQAQIVWVDIQHTGENERLIRWWD